MNYVILIALLENKYSVIRRLWFQKNKSDFINMKNLIRIALAVGLYHIIYMTLTVRIKISRARYQLFIRFLSSLSY